MPLEPIVIDFLLSTSIGEVHIVALMAPHSYDNQAASQMRNILQQPEYHRISPVNPDPFLGTWPADQSVPHLNTSRLFPVILILQIHNILKPMLS